MKRKFVYTFFIVLFFFVTGCAYDHEIVREITKPNVSPVVEQELVSIEDIVDREPPQPDYTIGPNDVVFISIFGKPEWGSSVLTLSNPNMNGNRVDGSGNIYLPLVGKVNVNGLTVDQARLLLEEKYKYYLKNPSIVIEISEYKSKAIYLMGQFREPGTYYMDRPMKLLHGMSLGKGLVESANFRSARILREGRIMPVDVYRLLREGDVSQNVWLRQGDVIYVPDLRDQNVFVIGAVKKPGAVPLVSRMTLLQALAEAGFDETLSYSRYIRIIRSFSPTRGALIVLDLKKIVEGETLDFELMEDDVIYIAKSPIGTWNVALNEIIPSLQAISSLLTPFVQIKFLSQ